ncbi:uncharacterized protein SCODWIG_02263 [Saccharomycodes ludwigii]|uniref:Oxidoreductase n=1 Tax=Saccharomycodes ludwigii TaxID=36035 RepID=A0A376B777_9ASCO|nr:uncharacterized protein SCODWIG_02263 [Saccharomycodes ludwigii]
MSVINVGIVGTGIFARDRHLPSYKELSDKFKVVSCYNRTRSKAEEFAKLADIPKNKVFNSIEEIVADPEVELIDALVPVQFNLDVVKTCLKAGKPVSLEKPIAATMQQARALVKLTDDSDVPVSIGENWLHLESIAALKKAVKEIGPIVSFTYNSTGAFVTKNKYLSTSWRQHPEHIGGFLSDGGVHQLALLTSVLGEIKSVSALTKQVRKESGADDIVFSTVKLKSDVIGTFTYGSAFGQTNKWTVFKIYGLNGSVFLDISDKKEPKITVFVGGCAEENLKNETITVKEDESFGVNAEFVNFYQAVVAKDKNLILGTPRTCFHHLACVAAFLESSSKNGDHVDVETV